MTSFNVVLVNNLFLFRRFDDNGHHYQEKYVPNQIILSIIIIFIKYNGTSLITLISINVRSDFCFIFF